MLNRRISNIVEHELWTKQNHEDGDENHVDVVALTENSVAYRITSSKNSGDFPSGIIEIISFNRNRFDDGAPIKAPMISPMYFQINGISTAISGAISMTNLNLQEDDELSFNLDRMPNFITNPLRMPLVERIFP